MYKIEYFRLQQIGQLEKDWRALEKGSEMTYFQRYDWYSMLAGLNMEIQSRKFEIVIAAVSTSNTITLIAPLWIVKKTFGKFNRRGIYFFGRAQWSDYLNFIYSDFDETAVAALLNDVKDKYGVNNFVLEDVPVTSSLYQYINGRYTHLEGNGNTCVELFIPENLEAYHKMLSKNARQNIRTAFNRAEKDGLEFTFCFDDKNVDLEEFSRYRNVRLGNKIKKGGTTLKSKLVYFISTKILKRGVYEFVPYTPYTHDKNALFITCKDQKGNLCAGFCYGIDQVHHQIVLMAVSTNPNYYKYSPGILSIYRFVLEQIENHGYKKIDFTRGSEKYKYVLGGVEHFNQKLEFILY